MNPKRLGIVADHGGFALKELLLIHLHAAGHETIDFGARFLDPEDDYPAFVVPLGYAVAAGKIQRGIAICGSGVGAAVCANKVPGVRAALIHDRFSAQQGVEDDHMNVLCLGPAPDTRRWTRWPMRPAVPRRSNDALKRVRGSSGSAGPAMPQPGRGIVRAHASIR